MAFMWPAAVPALLFLCALVLPSSCRVALWMRAIECMHSLLECMHWHIIAHFCLLIPD